MSNKTRKITQQVHLFKAEDGTLYDWTMEDAVEAGTPIDPETGDDLKYVGPKPPESEIGNYFNTEELESTYVDPDDRFVVSLLVGYNPADGHVLTVEEAANAALQLTHDGDSGGTNWYVHDRETKKTVMLEQSSFDGRNIYG